MKDIVRISEMEGEDRWERCEVRWYAEEGRGGEGRDEWSSVKEREYVSAVQCSAVQRSRMERKGD